MDKVVPSAVDAVADISDGASLAVGGFGLCGVPSVLIAALLEAGVKDLECVSNNCGVDDWGLGQLLMAKRLRRMVASYVGENKEFARQYLEGELEVELTPQGTLAERMRAGGSGIPGFFTATGVGTQVADGGLPWRYDSAGNVVVASPPKETRVFETAEGDKTFVLERAIVCDFGLVRAWKGDRHGNLVYRRAARNFNPVAAMSGRITIAEVEELVEPGEIDPDQVHTPGVFVHRVVPLTPAQVAEKRIERVTVRPRVAGALRQAQGTEEAAQGAAGGAALRQAQGAEGAAQGAEAAAAQGAAGGAALRQAQGAEEAAQAVEGAS
ncbi:succinyl-CoA--3-ketoacid CoA transferase subunit A [Microlunatus panaciterrae]|uniref:3-oxoacid CoA-transferase subunit A n=1 Tax=Microlunatus panaciterrae TaxID=400768 RepID=A0ABS2RJJ6_9ACTN|nr:CoA transferase subunit A [Microlunatus panaciterrae]MBM7799183.1 3-oxoacid CoA-transferase subunit A [Microlunatus panaciterrae]